MMSDYDYNEWTTEDLQSLFDEILPILKERYEKEANILRKENDDDHEGNAYPTNTRCD